MSNEDKLTPEQEEQKALHEQVTTALKGLGADVKAAPQIAVDDQGYIRVIAVPMVVKAAPKDEEAAAEEVKDEEPKNKPAGKGSDDKPVSDKA